MKLTCSAKWLVAALLIIVSSGTYAQQPVPVKPRVLISTDIGGTDPDDNQSMIHLLMYSDRVEIEGLVSSPSFGSGSADEIRRMIDLYEKDYPILVKHAPVLAAPDRLRSLCKQGSSRQAPYKGYSLPTEGSEWIVRQARKDSDRNLYEGKQQGAKTIRKWRNEILEDWAARWRWLREYQYSRKD